MKAKKIIVILIHAFVGWGLCGALIGIGRNVTSMQITLIAHAIGAPIVFAIITLIYFKWFRYTTALQTAAAFIFFVILMDVLVVALLIENSFEMFTSILGTWLPFALIFAAVYLTGLWQTGLRNIRK
jgi:hypothetical protein